MSRKAWIIVIVLVVVFAIAGIGYYFYTRRAYVSIEEADWLNDTADFVMSMDGTVYQGRFNYGDQAITRYADNDISFNIGYPSTGKILVFTIFKGGEVKKMVTVDFSNQQINY